MYLGRASTTSTLQEYHQQEGLAPRNVKPVASPNIQLWFLGLANTLVTRAWEGLHRDSGLLRGLILDLRLQEFLGPANTMMRAAKSSDLMPLKFL